MLFLDGSNGFLNVSLGSGAVALVGKIVYDILISRQTKKNGNGETCHCQAGDLEYWDRMDDHVTKPIVEAIRAANVEQERRR